MKTLLLLFSLLFLPQAVHAADVLHAEKPKKGFFDKTNCSPNLNWPKAEDAAVLYDLAVYESVSALDQPPAAGKEVFYKEKLKENTLQLSNPLEPKKKYLWSYRYRKDGKTSSWASYSKKYNHLITWGELQGLLFGFETSECQESPSVNSKEKKSSSKVYKKLSSDDEISSLLESGMSGIVFPFGGYTYGKDDAAFIQSAKSLEEMQTKLKSTSSFNGAYTIVYPPGKTKDERLTPNKDKLLILIAEPGEYILTYWVIDLYVQTLSLKLDLRIPVEKGKLKYGGDFIVLAMKSFGLSNFEIMLPSRPETFLNFMKEKYPKTSPYIIFDKEKKK